MVTAKNADGWVSVQNSALYVIPDSPSRAASTPGTTQLARGTLHPSRTFLILLYMAPAMLQLLSVSGPCGEMVQCVTEPFLVQSAHQQSMDYSTLSLWRY